MKKLLAIILVFSLLFLSACNEGSDNADRPDVDIIDNEPIDIGDVDLFLSDQVIENGACIQLITFNEKVDQVL